MPQLPRGQKPFRQMSLVISQPFFRLFVIENLIRCANNRNDGILEIERKAGERESNSR